MIKSFLATHGNGFWLHMLGAMAIMLVGWWFNFLLPALIFNTALWLLRELTHKIRIGNWRRFFTFHVWLEWVPAVATGFIAYGSLRT